MNMNSSAVVNVTFWVVYSDEDTSVEALVYVVFSDKGTSVGAGKPLVCVGYSDEDTIVEAW